MSSGKTIRCAVRTNGARSRRATTESAIKSDASCGGPVKEVTYNATCLSGIEHPIMFNTHYGAWSGTSGTPQYTDIVARASHLGFGFACRPPMRHNVRFI